MTENLKAVDAKQVIDVITWANGEEKTVELVGGGSKVGLGRPIPADFRLHLCALEGVDLYEPEELVLRAGAATPLGQIRAILAQQRQQLAFEPPDFSGLYGHVKDQTIGGVLSSNLSGPRRIKAGAARDHFLGLEGVSGRGGEFKSGGRVVKNVTGYDLCKLMAGSFGTLAALTKVTMKVLPAPEKNRTVLLFGKTDGEAIKAMSQAAGSPNEVSALAHLPNDIATRSKVSYVREAGASVTAVRVEGHGPSVEHRTDSLRQLLGNFGEIEELHSHNSGTFWLEVANVASLLPNPDAVIWKISVTPSIGANVLGTVRANGGEGYYDWAGGLIWLAIGNDNDGGAEIIRSTFGKNEGHATLMRGPAELRKRVDVFQPVAPNLAALSMRIKNSFDPRGVLNPGRMHGAY